MGYKRVLLGMQAILWICVATTSLTGCGADDSFSPEEKSHSSDYTYASAEDLSKTPCNESRDGRKAEVGSEKDLYECVFDSQDSVYIWVGENDTLSAEGSEFHRAESSSSSDDEDSSSSDEEYSSSSKSKSKSSSSSKSKLSSSSKSKLKSSSSSRSKLSSSSKSKSKSSSSSKSKLSSSSKSKSKSSSSSKSKSSSSSKSKSKSSSSYSSSSSVSSSSYSSSSSSSSSSQSSSSVGPRLKIKGEHFNPNAIYGTMTDPRDNKTYRTVQINGQIWMAENLNFAGNKEGKSSCYGNDDNLCEIYGRLYTREAAMNSSTCGTNATCNLGPAVQGVCPNGWHIPSLAETNDLMGLLGKSMNSWVASKGWAIDRSNGDDFGMSFIPAGLEGINDYEHIDSTAFMWVYQPNGKQRYLVLNSESGMAFIHDYASYVALPVRCVEGAVALSSSSSSSPYSSFSIGELSTPITKKDEQFNPDIEYGTMTDSRDGKIYKTVVVKGRTWMAENLNFEGNVDFPLQKQYSLCYGNEDNNCELYGRLYSREAAMNSTECGYNTNCNLADPLQGACPAGWHIPSKEEAMELNNLALPSFRELTSAKGWGNDSVSILAGKDTYGLSFLPAGYKLGPEFKNIDLNAFMWANIPGNSQRYFVINPTVENKTFLHNGYDANVIYGSIRCVKTE